MPDWYRTHSASPECYPESEYLEWAQGNGLYVDAAGNVDYGPPEPVADDDDVRAYVSRQWADVWDSPEDAAYDLPDQGGLKDG